MLKAQIWTQDSRWGLTRVELRGRIVFLDLLATLLFMQPRLPLLFWAASTHWQVTLSFLSPSTPPSLSPQGCCCSQSILCPACICARDCPDLCAGHSANSLCTEWSICQNLVSPIWKKSCYVRQCQMLCSSPGRWHQLLFPYSPVQ